MKTSPRRPASMRAVALLASSTILFPAVASAYQFNRKLQVSTKIKAVQQGTDADTTSAGPQQTTTPPLQQPYENLEKKNLIVPDPERLNALSQSSSPSTFEHTPFPALFAVDTTTSRGSNCRGQQDHVDAKILVPGALCGAVGLENVVGQHIIKNSETRSPPGELNDGGLSEIDIDLSDEEPQLPVGRSATLHHGASSAEVGEIDPLSVRRVSSLPIMARQTSSAAGYDADETADALASFALEILEGDKGKKSTTSAGNANGAASDEPGAASASENNDAEMNTEQADAPPRRCSCLFSKADSWWKACFRSK
ncbi:unnamed protein product [Amoebophrya sp. A120]|nr:unnamed protein product [Amoebophrya sp. A120]|eukprot:GSA120T00007346001.1